MASDASEAALIIPGIDGATPLGFLAALGLLRVLEEHSVATGRKPRLNWKLVDTWRPTLQGVNSVAELAQIVFDDRARRTDSPVLKFRYVKQEKQGPKSVGGLKAPLGVVRAWVHERREKRDEASLAHAAALFCQDVTEINKQPATLADYNAEGIQVDREVDIERTVERSFLDFTSRNAQFLEQVEKIRESVTTVDRVREALETGHVDYDAERSLDWDPASDTPGAIYTGFRRGFLPVHEWLGFLALELFPLAGTGQKVRMTACSGRRLDGEFTWPLWERPASIRVIYGLLGHPDLPKFDPQTRRLFGISEIFAAGLTKKADGYTGTFAPGRAI